VPSKMASTWSVPGGLLTKLAKLAKSVIEAALGGELTVHLGYEAHDPAGRRSGNDRRQGGVGVGRHCRIGILSPAEHHSYGRARSDSGARPPNGSFRDATDPRSRVSDGLIEAGGCPDRSDLRHSSVVLVNQATQQIPASD
jgi:hypothetical protein